MASKVYFADLRADYHENLQQKLTRLLKTAGMGDIDFNEKFVAIKLHFGEPGNLAYLRPNWAKTVADFVKERGGKPFLTDCNTLYVGGRKNALDHMDSAMVNGFNYMTTGCQIIIADGLKGNDEVEVPVAGGEYVKNAKIGRAVMDADVFTALLAGVIGSSIDEPEGWSLAETVGFSAFALVFAVFGVFLIFHVRRRLVVEGGVFSYLPTFGRSRAFRLADIAGMTIGTNGRRLVGQDGRTLARFEDNQENSAILLQYLSEHGVGLLVK